MFNKRLAIFDLDNTILDGDSDFGFINFLAEENIIPDRYKETNQRYMDCLLYTSPSPRDQRGSRMPSSA